ncbi:hypothetical protein GP486_001678 [Trichoglossum hirsutum]|uniref:Ubiquitin-conjugating enzyme E2C-binding protein n=1 Tax=Trichoglossum hirsutum TaxID=265104 RepID=A0A9P8LGP4_9PEZI|nr:hypothetical protein GP486_001678 [Trichoglossum hirsutum]
MKCDITLGDATYGPLPSSIPAVVYAELLLNIRQVNIFVSLPTPSSPETKAELSSDGLSFSVTHDGRVSTLRLPTKVAGLPPSNLPPAPTKELSFRLPLAQLASHATSADPDNITPWAANSLATTAVLSCRKCGATLVEAGAIKVWKDLPSENWAEMMEFWHCHKPGEHGNPNEGNHIGKGYTAGEKITADTALGLVDLCYFLLSEKDCSGVEVRCCISFTIRILHAVGNINPSVRASRRRPSPETSRLNGEVTDTVARDQHYSPSKSHMPCLSSSFAFYSKKGYLIAAQNTTKRLLQALACASCQVIVGAADERAEGWRLYKWSLAVQPAEEANTERFRADFFISVHLLALIETQGARKYIIETDGATPILLWVFNTDLRYSISNPPSVSQRAMKVFYQTPSSAVGQPDTKGKTPPPPEEVHLPLHIHQELRERLQESNRSLPTPARTFQEWGIALLDRFDN